MTTHAKKAAPIWHDGAAWCAGLVDQCGRFEVWQAASGRVRWRFSLLALPKVAMKFSEFMGARLLYEGGSNRWTVPAQQSAEVVARLLPYLQVRFEEASAFYRTVLVVTKPGGRMTRAVERFRLGMVERMKVADKEMRRLS